VNIQETEHGIRFEVRVLPRASKNEVIGEVEGAVKIKLTAAPLEGEANQALISFLAKISGVARKNVTIIKGETSRHKLVEITGIDKTEFLKRTGLPG